MVFFVFVYSMVDLRLAFSQVRVPISLRSRSAGCVSPMEGWKCSSGDQLHGWMLGSKPCQALDVKAESKQFPHSWP